MTSDQVTSRTHTIPQASQAYPAAKMANPAATNAMPVPVRKETATERTIVQERAIKFLRPDGSRLMELIQDNKKGTWWFTHGSIYGIVQPIESLEATDASIDRVLSQLREDITMLTAVRAGSVASN